MNPTNNLKNEAANLGNKIISDVMKAEQASGNRQAQLVMFMWENETTYNKDELLKFFKVTGADRTTLIEKAITNMSDDYAKAVELRDDYKAEAKADKAAFGRTNKPYTLEQTNAKLRAANILFIRAATGALHMRHVEAYGAKLATNGVISFYATARDDKGEPILDPKGNATSEKISLSGNALVRAGEKTLGTLVEHKKNKEKVTNPANGNRTVGIASVASVINNKVKQVVAAGAGIEDMSDEEETELNNLLHTLMAAKFCDEHGNVDRKTVIEYIEAEFPHKDTKAKSKTAA